MLKNRKSFVLGRNVFIIFTSYKGNQNLTMNRKVLVLWCSLFVCAFCACNKDVEEKWAQEEADLAEWMKENKRDAFFDSDIYIEKIGQKHEEHIQPETGDHVLVDFICTFLYDRVVEQVSYKDGQTNYDPQYRSK